MEAPDPVVYEALCASRWTDGKPIKAAIDRAQRRQLVRARQRGLRTLTALIAERDGESRCVWCRRALWPTRRSLDHVVPRSDGGSDQPVNLVLACLACNQERGRRTVADWLAVCVGYGWQPRIDLVNARLEAMGHPAVRAHSVTQPQPYVSR